MPESPSIREATPADAGVLAAMYNAAVSSGDVLLDDAPKRAVDVREWIEGLGAREACLVLERGGEVVGWGAVRRYSDRAGYRFCGETFIYVRREARRRGYGTRLQRALVERCRGFRYHHLLARVWAVNAGSRTFHERHGYEVVGVQREIGYAHGRRQDLVVMQRVLDDEDRKP